jgi:capsular polysaccharide biosynthesis protein
MGFIRAAIRRKAWFWMSMALAGLAISAGLYLKSPPVYQASTSLLLTVGPEAAPGAAIADNQTIAQSRAVAALALHKLGLQESVSGFVGSYTATPVTDRILQITVSSPSASDAITRANAVATAFLRYRATMLETQQRNLFTSLDQQVSQAKQQVTSIDNQIRQLVGQPGSSVQQARLGRLRAERSQATSALAALGQSVNGDKANSRELTASEVAGSGVLDAAAPIPQSPHTRLKHLIVYAAVGLIPGLVLGIGAVIVGALISDRLRRRDDIAHALGAPVKLSVGKVRLGRWRRGPRGLEAAQDPNVRQIAAYLREAVPARSRGIVTLAVVPADEPQVAALALASLAVSCAQEGARVVMADLYRDSPAARLLGITGVGVQSVNIERSHLVVAVPEPDDAAPMGPLQHRAKVAEPLAAAFSSADLLLTLAALDPSLSGEHLGTWATDAVVTVTAGLSTWTRIHAVGEMVRLAGTHLVSAVLIGADKTDDSLGITTTRDAYPRAEFAEKGPHADGEHSLHHPRPEPSRRSV